MENINLYNDDVAEMMTTTANEYASSPVDYFDGVEEDQALCTLKSVYENLFLKDRDAYKSNDVKTMIDDLNLAANKDAQKVLADVIFNDMYEDFDLPDMYMTNEREHFKRRLMDDYGLLKGIESYLIIGSGMGWRQLNGHNLVDIESVEDIIDALHGNYDYHEVISKDKDKAYFEAMVYTHDAPTGESYKIIPASYLKAVFEKDQDMKEIIMDLIQDDDEVELFVKTAIPDLAKDDIVAGILTVVAQTRGEEFEYLMDLADSQKDFCKDAMACGLVLSSYDEIHESIATTTDSFHDRVCVAYAIEAMQNPLNRVSWRNAGRTAFMDEHHAVKAMRWMLDNVIPQKIKETVDDLFSQQREERLRRLEELGKNLDSMF